MMGVGSTFVLSSECEWLWSSWYLCTEMCSTCFQRSGRTVIASTTHTSPLRSFRRTTANQGKLISL